MSAAILFLICALGGTPHWATCAKAKQFKRDHTEAVRIRSMKF